MTAFPAVSNHPARVPIVEDEQAQRGAIAGALRRAGYTVGAWADGSDVERIVAATDPRVGARLVAWLPSVGATDGDGSGPGEGPEPAHDSRLSTWRVQSSNSQA
jgi:hypothetical protein